MTSHSKYGYYVRNVTGWMWTASGGWMDTGQSRAFGNNLLHLLDESNDSVINVALPTGEIINAQTAPSLSFVRTQEIHGHTIPLHQLQDGGSSWVVIKITLFVVGTGSTTVRFALRPRQGGTYTTPVAVVGDVSVADVTTTSNVAIDLTATIRVSPAMLRSARTTTGAGRGVHPSLRADGSLGSGECFEARLDCWTKMGKITDTTSIVAFSAREFVGP